MRVSAGGLWISRRGIDFIRGEGMAISAKDVAWVEDCVRRVLAPISQSQFDALASLIYNIGCTAFRRSTLLKRLNAYEYDSAANEFCRWNKSGGKVIKGLGRRREAEREMFLSS